MHTFPVVTEGHLCLPQANCVFTFADPIELFEFCLINALRYIVSQLLPKICGTCKKEIWLATHLIWEIDLQGFYANIAWSRSHVDRDKGAL